jgi:hypothetical protein
MDEGSKAETLRLEYRGNRLKHDVAEKTYKLVALMQCVAKAAANSLEMCGQRMSPRQLDRRGSALVVYRMHQGSIFRAHVDRIYGNAFVLEYPLCA